MPRYVIDVLLGAGGMDKVYRAREPKVNRDVALKILPDSVTAYAERVARFRREAQVLATLNHPNIGHLFSALTHLVESASAGHVQGDAKDGDMGAFV